MKHFYIFVHTNGIQLARVASNKNMAAVDAGITFNHWDDIPSEWKVYKTKVKEQK